MCEYQFEGLCIGHIISVVSLEHFGTKLINKGSALQQFYVISYLIYAALDQSFVWLTSPGVDKYLHFGDPIWGQIKT